jgi:hypothetical protein
MGGQELKRGRAAPLAVLAAAVVLVSGCSEEKKAPPAPAKNPEVTALVTDRDIAATRRGSPERTILQWWRLTQFRAVEDGLTLLTPAARAEAERSGYSVLVVRWLGPWLSTGRPRIERVQKFGRDHVVVYMETTFNTPVGTDLVRKQVDTLGFALDRSSGGWLISDPSWIIQQANTLREQQEDAKRAARDAARRAPK